MSAPQDVVAVHGFTHRRSTGVGRPPFDDANLALHVGDDPARVQENRRLFAERRGADPSSVAWMDQVHGADVLVLDAPPTTPPAVDALVTARPGVLLAVLVADCVPIVVVGDRAVGVAHAGRRGAAAGIASNVVATLRALDDGPLLARLGPAICGGCYEVPDVMRDEVEATLPGSACRTAQGTAGLDLRAGLARQLASLGVEVQMSSTCTAEAPHLFSHRRDGVTGRQAGYALLIGSGLTG